MRRSHVVALAAVALLGNVAAAKAGPCTGQIVILEQEVGSFTLGPADDQSTRQRQPAVGPVPNAASRANADAAAALARARRADAIGDVNGCNKALDEARFLYGIQ